MSSVENNSNSSLWSQSWERAEQAVAVGKKNVEQAAVVGGALASGASALYSLARSSTAIVVVIQSLPHSSYFDPFVYALGAPSLFGFVGTCMIPVHLHSGYAAMTNSDSLKTKVVSVLKSAGNLGVALGATAQAVIFIWEEARKHLIWLPGFQLSAAILAGFDIVLSIFHLNRLQQLEKKLDEVKDLKSIVDSGQKLYTPESAEKYYGIPQARFEKFDQALKEEADLGLSVLKGRVQLKIEEKRLKIIAGILTVLALAVLAAIAFTPTPLAPVALSVLTATAYGLATASSILNIASIYKNYLLLNPFFGITAKAESKAVDVSIDLASVNLTAAAGAA